MLIEDNTGYHDGSYLTYENTGEIADAITSIQAAYCDGHAKFSQGSYAGWDAPLSETTS